VALPSGSHLWFPGIPAGPLRSPLLSAGGVGVGVDRWLGLGLGLRAEGRSLLNLRLNGECRMDMGSAGGARISASGSVSRDLQRASASTA
jgi:hypothetical protein